MFTERPHLDQVAELAGQPEAESRARFPLGFDPARERCVETAAVPHLASKSAVEADTASVGAATA
jgi:hypothetical protein